MERSFVLAKTSFNEFFKVLKTLGTVYAPVKVSDQSFSYHPVELESEIAFEALRTILPPKKFFYPAQETVITYDQNGVNEHEAPAKFKVVFGVHPCDLAGLGIMDTIFSAGPADSHYLKKRAASLIIGLSCLPDKHCFCQSMGTDSVESGYDIFLTDIDKDFFVEVVTPNGFKAIEPLGKLITPATEANRQRYKAFWNKRAEAFTNGFQSENLRSLVAMERNNNIWEELGKRCLSCGNCTPVCPTCYCFDLVDIAGLDSKSGERQREWDSCQFNGFAAVTGDFNFRANPVDRFKFWYKHKLHGFDDPYGFKTCVGCGRCTVSCPAGIDDIVSVVKALQGNKKQNDNA